MSDRLERMAQVMEAMGQEIAWLKRQMDETAERQATFGRPRYLIWGQLEGELPAGGSQDVQLRAREQTSPGVWEWVDKLLMEDVLAPPLMPEGTCLPATVGDHATWVCVAWFPLDEEYYVIGAEICPTTDCASGSSSS